MTTELPAPLTAAWPVVELFDGPKQQRPDFSVSLSCGHHDDVMYTGKRTPTGDPIPVWVGFSIDGRSTSALTALEAVELPPLDDAAAHEAALRRYMIESADCSMTRRRSSSSPAPRARRSSWRVSPYRTRTTS